MNIEMNEHILEVKNLKMYFPVLRGLLQRKVGDVKAVDNVNFSLKKGETLGLVGESGCGKTTVGRCILRLYEPSSGQIIFNGENLLEQTEKEMRETRRNIAIIFQDPYSSLNPRQNAFQIVAEPLIIHNLVTSKAELKDRVDELFRIVGLDPNMSNRFAHQFSGGQRQRIGIARAIACDPSLIICDEPISALDVSIQAQIINLLEELQSRLKGLSYLFIAHDLSVVRHISHRIVVMYLGRIMEVTDSQTLYKNPLHPYTRALLSAVPIADPEVEENREHIVLQGEVPSPMNPPKGCAFHPRCPLATSDCKNTVPLLETVDEGHQVACIMVQKNRR